MKTIKAIIIDDEKHARESLDALLKLYTPEVKIIAESDNIKDGRELIEKLAPDLVFLDIEIGKETGFDLLELIKPVSFQLIFVTAFNEFAEKAFRVNALDYLLKPVNPKQLQEAIQKVKHRVDYTQLELQLTNLAQSFNRQPNKQLTISSIEGITFLEINEIIYINGSGNYSTFFMVDEGKIMASKSLKYYEPLLSNEQFYRCHQSYLVNLKYIKRIIKLDGNIIEFKNGDQVPIAQQRKEALMKLLALH